MTSITRKPVSRGQFDERVLSMKAKLRRLDFIFDLADAETIGGCGQHCKEAMCYVYARFDGKFETRLMSEDDTWRMMNDIIDSAKMRRIQAYFERLDRFRRACPPA